MSTAVRRERQAQDPRCARVDGLDGAAAIEHDHARGEVVEDGLQIGARAFHLDDAAMHQLARVGKLLGHVGERARQSAQLVVRREHGLRAEVAARHLLDALGQQQQRLRELVAERDGKQQRAEHREHQRQRQRADVHLAQARARQRALLVLAVGAGHSQRRRDRLGDDEITLLLAEREVAARNERNCAHPRRGAGGRGVFVEAVGLADDALRLRLAQQRKREPLGHQARGGRAGREQALAGAADHADLLCRELLAQALQAQRRRRLRRCGRRWRHRRRGTGRRGRGGVWARTGYAASRVLVASSATIESIVPRPRFRPASSAPSTLTSNQLSIERETNW